MLTQSVKIFLCLFLGTSIKNVTETYQSMCLCILSIKGTQNLCLYLKVNCAFFGGSTDIISICTTMSSEVYKNEEQKAL